MIATSSTRKKGVHAFRRATESRSECIEAMAEAAAGTLIAGEQAWRTANAQSSFFSGLPFSTIFAALLQSLSSGGVLGGVCAPAAEALALMASDAIPQRTTSFTRRNGSLSRDMRSLLMSVGLNW
ncbi:MAG TPA: hypothetical protein VJL28_05705 [Gemmatimonadaceae bacterium]|nr:hypothetical protein [Gemmatimonadaceae bacterium]